VFAAKFVAIDEMGSNYGRNVFDSSCAGMLDHETLAKNQNAFLAQAQSATQQPAVSAAGKRILENVGAESTWKKAKDGP
jgi:hypothetical protein